MNVRAICVVALCLSASVAAAPNPDVLRVREWRAKNERQIVAELIQLVSLPNIAANKADIVKNADLLTSMFERRGFGVKRIETKGSPILVAERAAAKPAGTLTFYMHYDGQPTDARDWTIGQAFAPAAFRDGARVDVLAGAGPIDPDVRIYGRAVADDKGPIIAFLAAIDGLLAAKAVLPWTLRVVLDGEEEAGSPNFEPAMVANRSIVAADLAIIVDSPRHASNLPTVFYGSRGLTGAEITIYGAIGDLHSGNYGNFVPDPAMALTKLLASMKDDRGNVTIKGFYDDVVPLTASERRAIDEIPNVDQKLLEQFGVAQAEHPDSRIELQHNRPTLSVVGLSSGTIGAGARNAISSSATGRVEIRLVNGLDPQKQFDRLVAHVREQGFHLVTAAPDQATRRKFPKIARITQQGGGFPIGKGSMDDPRTAMAVNAIRSLDQRLVQMPTIGGSLPFSTFSAALKLPTIGLAVVNFDNNQHAANENLRLGHLWEAIDIFAALVTMTR
ncbi:MAG TPA: M20/M25/M40 family metallo-hydrolase [Vicinamibacterales bacterium]|nr:M20/M25/M40 family metallo-hydrolase [Vicinamibacterales bacterium]